MSGLTSVRYSARYSGGGSAGSCARYLPAYKRQETRDTETRDIFLGYPSPNRYLGTPREADDLDSEAKR